MTLALTGLPLLAQYIIVVFLGLVLGSFATAVLYRVPRGIPWGVLNEKKLNRSVCTHCNTPLEPLDLVPVFSWLALRGKCRHCKKDIGTVYLFAELLTLAACLGIFHEWGLTSGSVLAMFAMPFFVALLIIDLQTYTLPNQLVAITGAIGLVRLLIGWDNGIDIPELLFEYILGAAVYAALAWVLGFAMARLLKKDALGQGDVKFFAVAGLWLGISNLGWFCILSGILGVVLGIAWKALKKGDIFPFGPALILSLYLLLII